MHSVRIHATFDTKFNALLLTRIQFSGRKSLSGMSYNHTHRDSQFDQTGVVVVQALVVAKPPLTLGSGGIVFWSDNLSDKSGNTPIAEVSSHTLYVAGEEVFGEFDQRVRFSLLT